MPWLVLPADVVVDGAEVWRRDAYGFAVRPQHLQRFREYAKIYKEEEEERAHRWRDFLDRLAESENVPSTPNISQSDDGAGGDDEGAQKAETVDSGTYNNQEGADEDNNQEGAGEDNNQEGAEEEAGNGEDMKKLENPKEAVAGDESRETNSEQEDLKDVTDNLDKLKEETHSNSEEKNVNGGSEETIDLSRGPEEFGEMNSYNLEKLVELSLDKGLLDELKPIKVESRRRVRASLRIIEKMMSYRVVKKDNGANDILGKGKTPLASVEEEGKAAEGSLEGEPAKETYLAEKVEHEETPSHLTHSALEEGNDRSYFPWKEELESLVRGGVPMALRGEVQLQIRFAT